MGPGFGVCGAGVGVILSPAMHPKKLLVSVLLLLASALVVRANTPPAQGAVTASDAHAMYVAAINSNDLGQLLAALTDDVVFLAPNSPPMAGKAAVKPWLEDYLKAYKTHWDKPVLEFVVNGDWAYERYAWTSTDTPLAGGDPVKDTGWGLLIYHHDADGKWRVARDAWGSDHPAK